MGVGAWQASEVGATPLPPSSYEFYLMAHAWAASVAIGLVSYFFIHGTQDRVMVGIVGRYTQPHDSL